MVASDKERLGIFIFSGSVIPIYPKPSLHSLLGTYCKLACISWLNYSPIVYYQQRRSGYEQID